MPVDEVGVGRLGAGIDSSVVNRLPIVMGIIVLAFAVFVVRLFQLQVIQSEDLGNRAKRNSIRSVRLEASRGDILDRFGRELATTRPAFGVQVMPAELRQRERTFAPIYSLIVGPHYTQYGIATIQMKAIKRRWSFTIIHK